jgi:hypothetical protein
MAVDHTVLDEMPAMDLDEVGPLIRDGDILLCSADDPFSRLIAWSTKSPWTHVGFAWRWESAGRIVALECVQRLGVRSTPLDRFISETSDGTRPYPGKIVVARHGGLAEADMPALIRTGVDHMGDRFSPGEIVKIGLRIAAGRWNRKTPRPLRPDNEMICSEYVDKCFRAAGVDIPWDGLGFIAPCDIAADPQVRAIARLQTR